MSDKLEALSVNTISAVVDMLYLSISDMPLFLYVYGSSVDEVSHDAIDVPNMKDGCVRE